MVGERERTIYAHAVAGALEAIGPAHADDALRVLLRVLKLTDEEARLVVAHGIATGILHAEDGKLSPSRRAKGAAERAVQASPAAPRPHGDRPSQAAV